MERCGDTHGGSTSNVLNLHGDILTSMSSFGWSECPGGFCPFNKNGFDHSFDGSGGDRDCLVGHGQAAHSKPTFDCSQGKCTVTLIAGRSNTTEIADAFKEYANYAGADLAPMSDHNWQASTIGCGGFDPTDRDTFPDKLNFVFCGFLNGGDDTHVCFAQGNRNGPWGHNNWYMASPAFTGTCTNNNSIEIRKR